MILNSALGIGSTIARIDALRIDTRLRNRAVGIRLAAYCDDIRSCN